MLNMKSIKEFIIEKFKINSKTVNTNYIDSDDYNDNDFIRPVKTKNGKEFQWFTWWKYLWDNGPMTKHDLLTHFNLQPTSYSTIFADLSKHNIIVPIKGKLEAKKPDEWKK